MNPADVTQPCSILVVDDDAEMASTLQEFLQKEGYIAEVAHSAAEAIAAKNKPAFLYYFGDHDPSGCDITRAVERGIREFAPESEISFQRVAVTREQIEAWDLPTRPTKQTDSRSKNFDGESVEVDAIPPARLRTMVRECIEQHIDQEALERTRMIEDQERQTLANIQEQFGA